MKQYFDDSKAFRTSRNIDVSHKRTKNATQHAAMLSTSRNTSSNAVLSNLSSSSRITKNLKPMTASSQNLFTSQSKFKDKKEIQKPSLANVTKNRRTGQRNRNSVEHLNSYKSSITNKSIDEKLANLKQMTQRSNLNMSEVQSKYASSSRIPPPQNVNPIKKPIIKNTQHLDFLEKAEVPKAKPKESKLNVNFLKSLKGQRLTFKHLFEKSSQDNKVYINEDNVEVSPTQVSFAQLDHFYCLVEKSPKYDKSQQCSGKVSFTYFEL